VILKLQRPRLNRTRKLDLILNQNVVVFNGDRRGLRDFAGLDFCAFNEDVVTLPVTRAGVKRSPTGAGVYQNAPAWPSAEVLL